MMWCVAEMTAFTEGISIHHTTVIKSKEEAVVRLRGYKISAIYVGHLHIYYSLLISEGNMILIVPT